MLALKETRTLSLLLSCSTYGWHALGFRYSTQNRRYSRMVAAIPVPSQSPTPSQSANDTNANKYYEAPSALMLASWTRTAPMVKAFDPATNTARRITSSSRSSRRLTVPLLFIVSRFHTGSLPLTMIGQSLLPSNRLKAPRSCLRLRQ
jgi:hypothetical protein